MEATRSLCEASVARMGLRVGTLARAGWMCLGGMGAAQEMSFPMAALSSGQGCIVLYTCHIYRLEATVGHAGSVSPASRYPGRPAMNDRAGGRLELSPVSPGGMILTGHPNWDVCW